MAADITPIKNILLVEDDPLDVELMLAALTKNQLAGNIAVMDNGAEALDYLYCKGAFAGRATGNPIFVLLDNKMPKVTGLELLKIMKADEGLKSIPVVVLTSSRETRDLREFYKNGVNAYVVKPVGFTKLMDVIKSIGTFWATVNEPPPAFPNPAAGFAKVTDSA